MTDRLQIIATAAGLCIVALMGWALLNTAAQCHAAGGTVVRGLFWLECFK